MSELTCTILFQDCSAAFFLFSALASHSKTFVELLLLHSLIYDLNFQAGLITSYLFFMKNETIADWWLLAHSILDSCI